jgi:hypothetical protein
MQIIVPYLQCERKTEEVTPPGRISDSMPPSVDETEGCVFDKIS